MSDQNRPFKSLAEAVTPREGRHDFDFEPEPDRAMLALSTIPDFDNGTGCQPAPDREKSTAVTPDDISAPDEN